MAQTTQVVMTTRYPLHKAQEVGSRFTKVLQEKGPSPAIKSVKFYHTSTLNGWQTTAYHEVEMDKIGEVVTYLSEWAQAYFDIEGYSFEITFAVTQEELTAALAAQQG